MICIDRNHPNTGIQMRLFIDKFAVPKEVVAKPFYIRAYIDN